MKLPLKERKENSLPVMRYTRSLLVEIKKKRVLANACSNISNSIAQHNRASEACEADGPQKANNSSRSVTMAECMRRCKR
ncbi:hypothetical protein AVEN_123470-1, partial [Araneus ventricosus]